MKINNILKSIAAVAAGVLLAGCQQTEQDTEARAVAAGETYLVFESRNAAEQEVPVYADGDWAVDVDSEWIEVSPMTGTGMGSITVKVTDNLATGGVDNLPRKGTITIQGGTALRNAVITVYQNGDTYFGVKEYTLAELADLDDETVGKLSNMDVVAVTKGGFILEQSGKRVFVQGAREVKAGDVVSLNGKKKTIYGNPGFEVDEVQVLQSKEIVYPTATDMTAQLGSYDGSILFCALKGSLVNGVLKVGSASVQILDPIDALGMDAVDLHKVTVSGYAVGKSGSTGYFVAVSVADEGADESLVPYPLKWAIGKDLNYSNATFNNDNPRIDPVQGIGYIEYVPFDLEGTNSQGNYKLDVSGNNPRVTGPWVNDYWLFYGNGAIKAGTDVEIAFEMRSSKWGQKFWLLEYLDGDQWLPAGEPQSSTEPGEEVFYTCATNIDGATNQPVMETIHFRKNNDHLQIRLRCVVNWRGGGDPMSPCRSTASSRLSITNVDDDTYRPHVTILKEGDGVEKDPVYANIEVSADLLTFNGTPDAPKTLKVKSDYDFTISTSYDWLTFDVAEGPAGEETAVAVTCAPSELSELREGTIRIVSEDSEKVINVVQSAAGQMLDPFISVSTGNYFEIPAVAGTKNLTIQSNTEFQTEVLADWLTLEALETKAMVDWTEYKVSYLANDVEAERTGTIRFYNTEKNLETVVTFVQAAKSPEPEFPEGVYFQDDFEWLAPFVAAYKASKTVAEGAMDPVANNLASHEQPNIWSIADLASTLGAEFEARGYIDLNKDAKTLYMQENYFKMGATNKHTGLQLPSVKFGETPVDADFTFDWCAHMTGKGVIDDVTITVEIVEGPGSFADTGTQKSGEIATAQETGHLAWQHAKVTLVGVTNATRIQIHPTHYNDGAGASQQRWHLDNIKIAEPEAPKPAVGEKLLEEWWKGGAKDITPSEYSASANRTTKVFGGASVTYTEGGSGTKLKDDGLVYYDKIANITDPNEDYRYNLLVSKGGGYLEMSGIPCEGVKTATLIYRSNYVVTNHQVTSATSGVLVGELSATTTPKLDLETKNTNTISCTVTIPEGTKSLILRITDTNSSSNIRVDGIELVVTEVW
ncbi:MAG: BACON domain-containing protein [Bacteroidales bacterium]|nr:BACON domain-containing protein [Bacteroidales bacterium]